MLEIIWTIADSQPNESNTGFMLGHLDVKGNIDSATSRGKAPSMMVALSFVELLDGTRRMLTSPQAKNYRFIGIGSHFSLEFEKSDDSLVLSCHGKKLHDAPAIDVVENLKRSVSIFFSDSSARFHLSESERIDLDQAVSDFASIHPSELK